MTSKKQRAKQKAGRTELILDEEVKKQLKAISMETGIPQSQIASLILEFGFDAISSGELDLSKYVEQARSPVWKYVLSMDRFRRRRKK